MADKKTRPAPLTSPVGIASFPWLNKPDITVWKNGVKDGEDPSKGKYKVTLILDKDNPDHVRFVEDLKARFEAAVKEELAKLEKAAKEEGKTAQKAYPNYFDKHGNFKEANYPWKDAKDDDTKWAVSFSSNAQYTKKDKTVVKLSPNLWTSDLKKWPATRIIGGGSRIKVSFNANSFNMASVGAGLSLQLNAVQVIKCESFGERSAADAGFKQEEGETYEEETQDGFGAQDSGDSGGSDEQREF